MFLRTALSIVMAGAAFLLSCGDESTSPTPSGNGDSMSTTTISGNLVTTDTPLARRVGTVATAAVSGYRIIAQALETRRIYIVTTESDGGFEFTVPGNDSYTFHILDDDYFYVAPVILDEFDPEADEVPEGMEVDTVDTDLGDVILSEDQFVAVLTSGDVVSIDSTMIAAAVNGIPAGADDQGAGTCSHSGSSLDIDGDGVINIMDSDDDGDGILDEFDDDWQQECYSEMGHIGLFSNFHSPLDEAGNPPVSPSDNQYVITVEFVVHESHENKVSSVCVDGPAYLDQFQINYSMGMTANWEEHNEKELIEGYGEGLLVADDERWGAFLYGTAAAHVWDVVEPGDVWVFEITYTENGTQYTELMAKKINFVFHDTPRNVYINGQLWTSATMYYLPDTVVFKWDTISALPGMTYTVGFIPHVNGRQYNDGGAGGCEAGVNGDSAVFVFADTVETGDTIELYHIDVIASDPYGDNAKTQGGFVSKWLSVE